MDATTYWPDTVLSTATAFLWCTTFTVSLPMSINLNHSQKLNDICDIVCRYIILLLVAWIFCLSGVCVSWIWLRTNNKYEFLEEAKELEHKLYQKRVMKCALVFGSFATLFLTLHFVFVRLEHKVERQLQDISHNATLESLHAMEAMLENETAPT